MKCRLSFTHHVFFFLLFLLVGCNWQKEDDGDDLLVSIYDKDLSKADVRNIVPDDASRNDSIEISEKYIQEWITKELLLQKAKLNVGEDEEIRKMVAEFENALLVKMYLQGLVDQKAENEPKQEDVDKYYHTYKDNFLLQEYLVRGSFLKLRLDAPRLKNVRTWLNSKKEKDLLALDDYCFQNATSYEHFNDKWISVSALSGFLSEGVDVKSRLFVAGGLIEQSDSMFYYFLQLKDVKAVNDTAPLEYVTPRIYKILRHQNKLNYLSTLKKSIYNEAIKDHVIVFYNEDK